MPHRDPETGQFVAGSGDWNDIEVVSFHGRFGVEAANNDGGTGFTGETDSLEGAQLIDYDEVVDRNEELQLLEAEHAMEVYINSTSTEDGTFRVMAEVSASPARQVAGLLATNDFTGDVVGGTTYDDSIDIVGRPLAATATAPFSDPGGTGVAGGGSAGHDAYTLRTAPAEFGRFHPRDELFLNAATVSWNNDDTGTHFEVTGQHVYGVRTV